MRTIAIIISSLIALPSLPVIGQETRTVTVIGQAKIDAKPDLATLELGVVVREAELAAAKEKVDQAIERIAKAVADLGIAPQEIIRSNVNVSSYPSDYNVADSPERFVVTRNVSVTVSVKLIQSVLQGATKAGANRVDDIAYRISDDSEMHRVALAAAIVDAKQQAKDLAEAFDAKLGKVIKIVADRYGTSSARILMSAPQQSQGDDSYIPEKITITRTVDAVFEIVD